MHLAQLMKEKGMTDAQLAKELGCVQSTVFHWKLGTYLPRADYVKKICEILQCSADDLLGVELEKPDRLSRAMATDLLKAITKNGTYNAQLIHQMATAWRRMRGGKVTEFELWLRNIAETLYAIELVQKQPKKPETDTNQLRLIG